MKKSTLLVAAIFIISGVCTGGPNKDSFNFKVGTPPIESIGSLAFGPDGILFVGDAQGATIYALDLNDLRRSTDPREINVKDIDHKIAAMLGSKVDDIQIHDLAVNPISQNAYLSVSRGDGNNILMRVSAGGSLDAVSLENVKYSKAHLPSPVDRDARDSRGRNMRSEVITDIAYADGKLFVAGLSNEEFSSSLRVISFPFTDDASFSTLEIFHAAHGQYETHAPIRTFMPYELSDGPHLLAAYTCTPLVTFPLHDLKSGAHVKGKTVAELGAGNRPLDMIAYDSGGKKYILLANSNRTLMKIDPDDIVPQATGLTDPVEVRYATAGVEYISVAQVGVQQLDNLNDDQVLVLQRMSDGSLDLRSIRKSRL